MSENSKRWLRLISLGIIGILIIIIGIGAVTIYSESPTTQERNILSQFFYDRNYNELTIGKKAFIDSNLMPSTQVKNAQFREWLIKWIVKPFGISIILIAALTIIHKKRKFIKSNLRTLIEAWRD